MDGPTAIEFLRCLGAHATVRGDWANCSCPLAEWTHQGGKDSSPSFGIKLGPQPFYHCWSCGGGGLPTLLGKLRSYGVKQSSRYNLDGAADILLGQSDGKLASPNLKSWEDVSAKSAPDNVFPDEWLAGFPRASKVPIAMQYLNSRGVSRKTSDALSLRWDVKRETVCFPNFNRQGQCIGLHGRFIAPKPRKDGGKPVRYWSYHYDDKRNPDAWYGEWLIKSDMPVVLVEGNFDLAAVYAVYPNVLALMSANPNKERWDRIERFLPEIITWFDNDKAGIALTAKVRERFGPQVIHSASHPTAKDPASTPPQYLKDEIDRALSYIKY